ncbi:MAG: prepilin-type N-terminal cleavage/methylation domain-containing protein [bacterium]|nr:prepilin-type N-terminal cleavage/methylation domain-containing protein [bacterium]
MGNNKGFTLIETIIYIALFAMVIGGGLVAAHQIVQATDASYNHIILQEEANFMFRKIDWALTGATSISASGSTLTVFKLISGVSTPLVFTLSGSDITLQRGGAPASILNSSSIGASSVLFAKTTGINGKPDSIASSFTLTTIQNGRPATQTFNFTKYLRK